MWRYEYLRHREHEAGKDNAPKSRPAALATTYVGKDGRTNLFRIPIAGKEPHKDRLAIEVPQIDRKRAGLGVGHAALGDCGRVVTTSSWKRLYILISKATAGALSAPHSRTRLRTCLSRQENGSVEHGEASRRVMPFGTGHHVRTVNSASFSFESFSIAPPHTA